jgi:hypothetical protein
MNRQMKLRGRILLEDDRTLTFHSTLHDNSAFSMPVDQFDVELNDPFTSSKRTVDGWLMVQQEAQQGSVVYLTLPKPTIAHGKQIVVRDLQLMPRQSSIDDFKKKIVGQKIPAPAPDPAPVVEAASAATDVEVDDPLAVVDDVELCIDDTPECSSGKCC